MNNFLLFNIIGEINQNMEEKFSVFFERVVDNPGLPVLVNINSCGGEYESVISIYNMLTSISDRLRCAITGRCSGFTNLIFLAAPKERRFAFYYASMTISAISDGPYISKNKELKDIFSNSFYLEDEVLNDIFDNNAEYLITRNKFIQYKIAGIVNHLNDIMC